MDQRLGLERAVESQRALHRLTPAPWRWEHVLLASRSERNDLRGGTSAPSAIGYALSDPARHLMRKHTTASPLDNEHAAHAW